MTTTRRSPGTRCAPPPAALTGTASGLSPPSTTAPYLPVSSSHGFIHANSPPPPSNAAMSALSPDSAHRGLSPCPAVTAVMRNPVYTVRSHRVHTSNCASVASQICHQHTHTRFCHSTRPYFSRFFVYFPGKQSCFCGWQPSTPGSPEPGSEPAETRQRLLRIHLVTQ